METSRSERERIRVDDPDGAVVTVPPEASSSEAAAIVAAVGTHLRDRRAAAGDAGGAEGWPGRRWRFAGRLAGLGCEPARVPQGTPPDPWTAAGRQDRF